MYGRSTEVIMLNLTCSVLLITIIEFFWHSHCLPIVACRPIVPSLKQIWVPALLWYTNLSPCSIMVNNITSVSCWLWWGGTWCILIWIACKTQAHHVELSNFNQCHLCSLCTACRDITDCKLVYHNNCR